MTSKAKLSCGDSGDDGPGIESMSPSRLAIGRRIGCHKERGKNTTRGNLARLQQPMADEMVEDGAEESGAGCAD